MNKPTNQPWQEIYDSMFNWADQVKQAEIDRWKLMYGFTPADLKQFISELLQRERKEAKSKCEKCDGWILRNGLCAECKTETFKSGYNYARKEMKQWAEEKDKGQNLIELQELLEELK